MKIVKNLIYKYRLVPFELITSRMMYNHRFWKETSLIRIHVLSSLGLFLELYHNRNDNEFFISIGYGDLYIFRWLSDVNEFAMMCNTNENDYSKIEGILRFIKHGNHENFNKKYGLI